MRIIVCIKPVPDPKHWNRLQLDPTTRTLIRKGIPGTINPLDRQALEAALTLREQHGGEVVILSMGPEDAKPVLKEALAMGADMAVLLSDVFFAGSDTLGTAYILSAGIKQLGEFDLILCGDETIDGGTAQVSAQLAEFLNVPNIMHVSSLEVPLGSDWRVRSQIEHGHMTIEVRPPVVLSVVKAINEPRYVPLMSILEAEGKEIRIWSAADLTLSEPWAGLKGSPTQMADLFAPTRRKMAELIPGDPGEQATKLADRLHRLGFC